jgi:hypothetical protein
MQIPVCITLECRGKRREKVPEIDFVNIEKKWEFGVLTEAGDGGVYTGTVGISSLKQKRSYVTKMAESLRFQLSHMRTTNAESNGNLIAAAPELYEACMAMAKAWNEYGFGSHKQFEEMENLHTGQFWQLTRQTESKDE